LVAHLRVIIEDQVFMSVAIQVSVKELRRAAAIGWTIGLGVALKGRGGWEGNGGKGKKKKRARPARSEAS